MSKPGTETIIGACTWLPVQPRFVSPSPGASRPLAPRPKTLPLPPDVSPPAPPAYAFLPPRNLQYLEVSEDSLRTELRVNTQPFAPPLWRVKRSLRR